MGASPAASQDHADAAQALLLGCFLGGSLDVTRCDVLDRARDDGVGLGKCLAHLHDSWIGDEGEDSGVAWRDRVLELVLELVAMVELTELPRGGAGRAESCRAAEDRRREDDAEGDAADDAPLETRTGAVVGGLLDVKLSVGVS